MALGDPLEIVVDRDSVCAGDDVDSHARVLSVPAASTLRELLASLERDRFLPGIAGGQATWVITVHERPVGVIAQQWPAPELVVPSEETLARLFESEPPMLKLAYWAQRDPMLVLSAIRAGEPLPSRWG